MPDLFTPNEHCNDNDDDELTKHHCVTDATKCYFSIRASTSATHYIWHSLCTYWKTSAL